MGRGRGILRDVLLSSPAKRFLLREPRFTILSTGRSGTRYAARLLTESGIKTGHEAWWNPYERRATTRLVGEVSWCATFHLEGYQGHVFHQIRDPLKVVASLATTELDPSWQATDNRLFYEWRRQSIGMTGDPIIDAMGVVLHWTRESERSSEWSYRVEDLDEATILEIAERAGLRVDWTKVRAALRAVPTTTNRRKHASIAWSDLPDGAVKAELLEIAGRYGYV